MLDCIYNFQKRHRGYLSKKQTGRAHIHKYQNINRKLYNCNENIYFNQKCLRNCITTGMSSLKNLKLVGWGEICGVQACYPLNDELNPVCHLQALLGAHRILHVFRIVVKFRLFSKSQKI